VPEAERAAMQARATGHEPVIAEARQLLGAALLARGDVARAREVLRAALTAAETCGHERIAARALIGLAEIAGDDEQQPRDALEQLEVAAAKLARTPDGPVTQATLMRLRATLQWRLGEHDAAIASLTRADVEATAGLGAGDSLVSELRRHLAWMLRTAGRDDEAQRVLAELAQLQPAAVREQAALGDRQAALELELELANEALTAAIQAQGERRPRVAGLLTEIGELDLALGRLAAAGDAFDHALQVLAAQPGNDKAIATTNLGQARLALRRGDPAAALRHSRSAYDLRRRAYHDVHGQTMAARLAIADALRAAGDEPAAKLAYGRVLTWVNNQRLIAPEHRALCRGLNLAGSASSPEHAECQRELDAGITRFLARQDADGPEVVGLDASIYLSVPGLVGLDRYPAVPTALYVVDETSARLRLLGEVREGGVAVAVSAIATDPDGVLHGFVYDRDSGTRLVTIDARTTTATPVGAGAPIAQRLTGAAFDPEGTLWVIVQDDKSIREFDLASHTLVGPTLKLPEAPLIGGADLAFDRDGVCYFLGAYTRGYWSTQNSTPLYTCDPRRRHLHQPGPAHRRRLRGQQRAPVLALGPGLLAARGLQRGVHDQRRPRRRGGRAHRPRRHDGHRHRRHRHQPRHVPLARPRRLRRAAHVHGVRGPLTGGRKSPQLNLGRPQQHSSRARAARRPEEFHMRNSARGVLPVVWILTACPVGDPAASDPQVSTTGDGTTDLSSDTGDRPDHRRRPGQRRPRQHRPGRV
jgi:tetratricopeptide (TPR) repeat protein